jgi:hypothetical protein
MNTKQKMNSGRNRMPTSMSVKNRAANLDGLVSHYPLSSVLVVFGIGLGVGVALGKMLGEPLMPRPSLGQRTELAAEKIGRQMRDAIAGVLPESLSKHIS